ADRSECPGQFLAQRQRLRLQRQRPVEQGGGPCPLPQPRQHRRQPNPHRRVLAVGWPDFLTDLSQQTAVYLGQRLRSGGGVDVTGPEVLAVKFRLQQRLEQRQRPVRVATPQRHLGEADRQPDVLRILLRQQLEQDQRLPVVPVPAQHVGEQTAGLVVRRLLLEDGAALGSSRVEVLHARKDAGQPLMVVECQREPLVQRQRLLRPARGSQHTGQLAADCRFLRLQRHRSLKDAARFHLFPVAEQHPPETRQECRIVRSPRLLTDSYCQGELRRGQLLGACGSRDITGPGGRALELRRQQCLEQRKSARTVAAPERYLRLSYLRLLVLWTVLDERLEQRRRARVLALPAQDIRQQPPGAPVSGFFLEYRMTLLGCPGEVVRGGMQGRQLIAILNRERQPVVLGQRFLVLSCR